MPVLHIERPRLRREMRDALKNDIFYVEDKKRKNEADANEADKRRRRAEKVFFA